MAISRTIVHCRLAWVMSLGCDRRPAAQRPLKRERSSRPRDYACAMSTVSSELQAELLREQMIPAFLAMLDDATALDEPAYLEQLAATLLVPLEQFEMPQQVASAVLDAVEARGDVDAAGLLAALGVLGAEPLSARAGGRAAPRGQGNRLADRWRTRDARRAGRRTN
jgi:hypothetical protein